MNGAIEHLVSLTALRDREQLDLSLAQALGSMMQARSAGVYRVVLDKASVARWLSCGLSRPDTLLAADPSWIDPDELPELDAFPLRQEALELQAVLQVSTRPPQLDGWLTLLPLMGDSHQPGVIEIETAQALTPAEIRQIETLLKVFDNFQRLLDSSQRDALTGLLNRQTFDTTFMAASLPRTVGISEEHEDRRRLVGDTWWLGVIDIDHFKQVNDRFGHLIGDEVLVLVARIMRQTFRHYDRLFRFGGEEFVVMLRCTEGEGAMAAFERMRHNMEHYAFPQVGQVTISIGVTQVLGSDTPSAAFSRADDAVYEAKRQGRNRVLNHEALVAQGAVEETRHEGDVELF
jgi:diguanylate cyclase (GGDEF)-like protein